MTKSDEQIINKKNDFQLSLKAFTALLLIPFIVSITLGNFIIFEKIFTIKHVSDTTIDELVQSALAEQQAARDIETIHRYVSIIYYSNDKEVREKTLILANELMQNIKLSQENHDQKITEQALILLNKLNDHVNQSEEGYIKFYIGYSVFFHELLSGNNLKINIHNQEVNVSELFTSINDIKNQNIATEINTILSHLEKNINQSQEPSSNQLENINRLKNIQTQFSELLAAQNKYYVFKEQSLKIRIQLDYILEKLIFSLVDSSINNIEGSFTNINKMLNEANYSNIFIFIIIVIFSITFISLSKKFILNNVQHIYRRLEMLKNENYTEDNSNFFITELNTINNILNDFGQELKIFYDDNKKLSKEKQQLEMLSNHDALTGVYNRRYMDTCLEKNLRALSRSETSLSLIMIDIDNFKNFNDALGHVQGDECLQLITKCIKNSLLRPNDLLFRYGGEEFVIILPNAYAEDAITVAKRILNNVHTQNIPHPASFVNYVTVSIGITTTTYNEKTTNSDIINKADQALYIAKKSGKNCFKHIND